MRNVSVARRYARALLDAAGDAGAEAALSGLLSVAAALEQSGELRALLGNPAFPRERRWKVMASLLAQLGIPSGVLENTLRLLNDRGRLPMVPAIARLFRDLADAKAGRVRGKVISANPLPPEVIARLEQGLERVTQRDVVLDTQVDPELIGGVSAQVGSIVYDGSLRTQLEEMRRALS